MVTVFCPYVTTTLDKTIIGFRPKALSFLSPTFKYSGRLIPSSWIIYFERALAFSGLTDNKRTYNHEKLQTVSIPPLKHPKLFDNQNLEIKGNFYPAPAQICCKQEAHSGKKRPSTSFFTFSLLSIPSPCTALPPAGEDR